ncbi:MAG TPA: hypothetical protein VKC60_10710 [Opitutaceae bacterium]|nr:hypothetical protein [Opitutaceae bacterium]
MNDTEYQTQLSRFDQFFSELDTPSQLRKKERHSDVQKVTSLVEEAATSARQVVGSEDPLRYEEALVALRRAVGSWRTADSRHGPVL